MMQARMTMREFIENIDQDEAMLKFASEHLDADENEVVEITIHDQNIVTYAIVGKVVPPHEDIVQ